MAEPSVGGGRRAGSRGTWAHTPQGHFYWLRPPARGRVSWALGFLGVVPGLGAVAAALATLCAYPFQRAKGGAAEENGRRAANWALTVLAWTVGVAALIANLLPAWDGSLASPAALAGGLAVALTIPVQLIVTVAGTVKAGRGRVLRAPAIPFLPAPRP